MCHSHEVIPWLRVKFFNPFASTCCNVIYEDLPPCLLSATFLPGLIITHSRIPPTRLPLSFLIALALYLCCAFRVRCYSMCALCVSWQFQVRSTSVLWSTVDGYHHSCYQCLLSRLCHFHSVTWPVVGLSGISYSVKMSSAFSIIVYLLIFGPCWVYAIYFLFERCRSMECWQSRRRSRIADSNQETTPSVAATSDGDGTETGDRASECECAWVD